MNVEWYIEGHRRMWNWIVEELKRGVIPIDSTSIKNRFLEEEMLKAHTNEERMMINEVICSVYCYACCFTDRNGFECENINEGCLFKWPFIDCSCKSYYPCVKSYYGKFIRAIKCEDYDTAIIAAEKIAGLEINNNVVVKCDGMKEAKEESNINE